MKRIIVGLIPAMRGTLFNSEPNDILHLQHFKLLFEIWGAEWRQKVWKTSIIKELKQNISRIRRDLQVSAERNLSRFLPYFYILPKILNWIGFCGVPAKWASRAFFIIHGIHKDWTNKLNSHVLSELEAKLLLFYSLIAQIKDENSVVFWRCLT